MKPQSKADADKAALVALAARMLGGPVALVATCEGCDWSNACDADSTGIALHKMADEHVRACGHGVNINPRTPPDSFTCPDCGATSYHPMDIAQGYCGRCHWWTSDPVLGQVRPPNQTTGGTT